MPAAPHGQAPSVRAGQKKSRPYGLFAPGTVSALAFKHADRFAGEGVEYATDEIELGVTLHAPAVFSGHFSLLKFMSRPCMSEAISTKQHRRSLAGVQIFTI